MRRVRERRRDQHALLRRKTRAVSNRCARDVPITCILPQLSAQEYTPYTMSICPVCLGPGGTVAACGCNALLHAECLANLIDHKYKRCKVCLASYTDTALLASARYRLTTAPTLQLLLSFVTSATNAGRHEQALSMLRALPYESLPDSSKCQYLFEKGRAHALLRMHAEAELNFLQALGMLQDKPRANPQHKALILVGLATALLDQKKVYAAAHYLCNVVKLTRFLRASVVESVMRTVARYCLELGNKHRYVMALRTVNQVVEAEEEDPVRRAAVLLEVRVGEALVGDCVIDAAFGRALRIVRVSRRYEDLLRDGAIVMSQHIQQQPRKRLRTKTHPEDVSVAPSRRLLHTRE